MPDYFSGTGDDGTTGLLGKERVPKFHPRPSAYGALDEAAAALGLARALAGAEATRQVIVQIQRDLYHIMAEVAATPDQADRFRELGAERVSWLEAELGRVGDQISMPKGFVVGGDSPPGAALDLARTIVRRAERAVVQLAHEGELNNPAMLAYLNRLSSLCFVLALWENQREGVASPTLAKPEA
ncbi:MAG: cob(I)yrinic acid a,c-diamide adenosyltransferase [Anaerolineales bacterium]